MRRTREELDNKIREISGFQNVYFQPPSKMNYPCILYQKEKNDKHNANDSMYLNKVRYTITIIGKESENEFLINKFLRSFKNIDSDRRYISPDNLYHDVLILYW